MASDPHFYYDYCFLLCICSRFALAEKIVHGSQEDQNKYLTISKLGILTIRLMSSKAGGYGKRRSPNTFLLSLERRLDEFEALVESWDRQMVETIIKTPLILARWPVVAAL